MPTQVAIQRGIARAGREPRGEEGAGRVYIALLVAEVSASVRCPGILRVLREGSINLWAGSTALSIFRKRHAGMGREPPIVAIARGKPVEQRQQRTFLSGAAGTADQA